MDSAGLDITALSINDPGPEFFGKDGLKVARRAHNFLSNITREHPGRFFGLVVLPLQDMDWPWLSWTGRSERRSFPGSVFQPTCLIAVLRRSLQPASFPRIDYHGAYSIFVVTVLFVTEECQRLAALPVFVGLSDPGAIIEAVSGHKWRRPLLFLALG